jgi:hypothetical protein
MTPPARPVFLTSAPFACGLAWLVNAMLALGYRTTSLVHLAHHWEPVANGRVRLGDAAREHMANHLPVLLEREEHAFKPGIEIFWEHRLRFEIDPSCPVVVVIRDPRDALFSLHRRWKANDWFPGDFVEFLDYPTDWPQHFPGLFHLDSVQTYVLFHLRWMHAATRRPVHFVRFEDLKSRPEETLRSVLSFLRLHGNDDNRIARAIANSSTDHARRVVATRSPTADMQAIHRGQAFEWKRGYDADALSRFEAPIVRALLREFGYEAVPSYLDTRIAPRARRSGSGVSTPLARMLISRRDEWKSDPACHGGRRLDGVAWLEQRSAWLRRHLLASRWAAACAHSDDEIPGLHRLFASACRHLANEGQLDHAYARCVSLPESGLS